MRVETDPGMAPSSLRSSWHPVAVADDLRDQPVRVNLLDKQIVLFRSGSKACALEDICIHRGTPLSLGSVTAEGNIMCPYHGWQYDYEGKCIHIPARPDGSIPRKARTTPISVIEAHGLVWASLEPAGSLSEWPTDAIPADQLRTVVCPPEEIQTSAGRVVDNFLDISHLPFVHDGILAVAQSPRVEPYEVQSTDDGFYFERYEKEPLELHSGPGHEVIHWEYFLQAPFVAHIKKATPSGRTTWITIAASPRSMRTTTAFFILARNYDLHPDSDAAHIAHHDRVSAQDRRIIEHQRPEALPTELRDELHIKDVDAASLAYRRILAGYGVEASFLP